MATISLRFFTVTMPDGKAYSTVGGSRRTVAERLGIPLSQVRSGCDLLRTPGLAEYQPVPVGSPNKPDSPISTESIHA